MALPLPKTFIRKKRAILLSLSTPLPTYTDASPKGSVDTAILPLIDQINSYEGLVTTSSCAGRVSVFLEGHKSEAAVGGKGSGNKWLFVSHEPLDLGPVTEEELRRTFGLASGEGVTRKRVTTHDQGQRLVRFQFEPMVGSSFGDLNENVELRSRVDITYHDGISQACPTCLGCSH